MNKAYFVPVFCILFLFCLSCSCIAAELAETTDVALRNISDVLSKNLNSSQTFGKPVYAGDYIVIPVIAKGVIFGYGSKLEDFGQSFKNVEKTKKAEKKAQTVLDLEQQDFHAL